MNIIKNIAVGDTSRLRKPVLRTMLPNLINVVPFCMLVEAIRLIFEACEGGELDMGRMWTIVGVLMAYMLVMAWGERGAYRANFRGAYETSAAGREAFAEHLRKLSLGKLYRHDLGELSSMLIRDFAMAETGMSHHLPQLMGAVVMPVLAFAGLLWVDWRMALAMFIALPAGMLMLWGSNVIQRRLSSEQIEAKIDAGSRLEEYLQGMRVMKAYGMVGEGFTRLRDAFREVRRTSMRTEAIVGPFAMLAVAVVRSGLTFMVLMGAYLMIDGELDIMTFVMFLVVGARVFEPLTAALVQFTELRHYAIAGERILKMNEEKEMGGEADAPAGGDIEFRDVVFGYGERTVLRGVTVKMERGKLTALVGPSGSGKSTMLKLCARFYDPAGGMVTMGGVDMRSVNPEKLMVRISMVFQDVYLFEGTIGDNIRFGKVGATDAEVVEAAKKARCHEFIMRLPKGYDTRVGEGGCTLSGGERQRLSIARAFLKDAEVVLLDEATASLDAENEREVQLAIDGLVRGRTVVVIAHKLKTVCGADKIVVLKDGEVEEMGKHEDLMWNKGLYWRLWNMQEEASGWKM